MKYVLWISRKAPHSLEGFWVGGINAAVRSKQDVLGKMLGQVALTRDPRAATVLHSLPGAMELRGILTHQDVAAVIMGIIE